MFKIGDVVRVTAVAEYGNWYIGWSPEEPAVVHDVGVITRPDVGAASGPKWYVRWFRTGKETEYWSEPVIEKVENQDD